MKIYLFPIVLISLLSCSEEPNNFSVDANKFLESVNGKKYKGLSQTEAMGFTFEITDTILAEYREGGITTIALRFKNTRNNGSSTTEGVYQQTRDPKKWRGIKIENGGDTLLRTPLATESNQIKWNTLCKFAQLEK